MKIADNIEINALDYAAQGNTILGIRGAGKTYTATKIAEELTKNGMHWIAIDPTGIWQNLRYGVNGHSGFPVLVAGGLEADVPLSEENVEQILQEVLDSRVSVVFDLRRILITKTGEYTSTKAAWRRIVLKIVSYLMEQNEHFGGLVHVFIEEAAEFVPQKPSEGGAQVYGALESMARIGRNLGIGYTLVNQRAEEIAKALFELCEQVIIHRQTGKNSLKSISDWLQYKDVDTRIVPELPKLLDGEAWVINENGETNIKVLEKESYHPNPKKHNIIMTEKQPINSALLEQMKHRINYSAKERLTVKQLQNSVTNEQILKLEKKVAEQEEIIDRLLRKNSVLNEILEEIGMIIQRNDTEGWAINHAPKEESLPGHQIAQVEEQSVLNDLAQDINGSDQLINKSQRSGEFRILQAAALFPEGITRTKAGFISGMNGKSGTFRNYISELRKKGLVVDGDGGSIKITELGKRTAGSTYKPRDLVDYWLNIVGASNGAGKMLVYLKKRYPDVVKRDELAGAINMSSSSGTFRNYLSDLRRAGLIEEPGKKVKLSDELFN